MYPLFSYTPLFSIFIMYLLSSAKIQVQPAVQPFHPGVQPGVQPAVQPAARPAAQPAVSPTNVQVQPAAVH